MSTFPENAAEFTWSIDDLTFSVVQHTYGHYCGYVRFPMRPVEEADYRGILSYVPVHGGITYSKESETGAIYGFDCNHLDDCDKPWLRDIDWLMNECENMALAIIIASTYEDEYLANEDNEMRSAIIERYETEVRDAGLISDYEWTSNMGVMINILCGQL